MHTHTEYDSRIHLLILRVRSLLGSGYVCVHETQGKTVVIGIAYMESTL